MTTHPPAEPLPGIVDPELGLALPLFDLADRRPEAEPLPAACPACGRPQHDRRECGKCRRMGASAPTLPDGEPAHPLRRPIAPLPTNKETTP